MTDDSKGGRIAIKFGASSSTSKAKTPASSLGKRQRSTTSSRAFGDGGGDDSDSDDGRGKHEAITGFGADGAETERQKKQAAEPKKEYVIARQPNRDWRDEIKEQRGARRSKNLLPADARAAQNGGSGSGNTTVDTAPADQDSGIQWGLTVKERRPPAANDDDGDDKDDTETTTPATADKDGKDDEQNRSVEPAQPRSADDEAMDALLGRRPAKEDKVIVTEDDAYARDVSAAGAASTLADYEAMPVEEFGAALLRGMGWNGEPTPSTTTGRPGAARSAAAREAPPRRRQNRLGLGAKALNEAEDLGGWDQTGPGGARKKRPPKLADYRREEERKKEERRGGGREDSYKREREREREDRYRDRDRDSGHRNGHRDRDRERDRDRHRGFDRDRRR
ncbi:hypothetical protein V2A60_008926 [Cordyceps javanica]|uniref:Pre-mRNA-splicing factor n=1 Tax=Cordyceps javanica TaxID=43265 RepID=A0A545VNA0_9HYPO|nr:G-patch domain-containing protein (Spp2) [Cordyceps javanica]TQW03156.1 G-patch domain protein (Spp2) [Cordyceps javanica]